jgi:rhodanese-related sulfurtransferase
MKMKFLYTLIIAFVFANAVHAQIPVKESWTRALLNQSLNTNLLSTDTIHKSITVVQADSLIKANDTNDNFVILDVRTSGEFILGHLKDAENIDFNDTSFNTLINDLDRDPIYLVYCGSGGRSGQALNLMVSMKFREVYNMLKGFSKWKSDGFPYVLDTATNIADFELVTKDLKLYPNPATDHLTLESNNPLISGTLSIFDLNGKEIIKQTVKDIKSEIDISSLSSGVYMLRLANNQTLETIRFVKQ